MLKNIFLSNFFALFLQTFYRESVEAKSTLPAAPNNDFMPNFTTKEEIPSSQNASSVISQWEKLPELRQEDEQEQRVEEEDEPDESFSEMKPSMMQENNITTTPVRKVVGQLKSEFEQAKKPKTWANAVKNEKSVVIINPSDNDKATEQKQPEECQTSDNKENEKESEESKINENPVWILPPEEPKKKKKKKKVKKED